MGSPADLVAVSRQLDGGLGFGVLVMAALGLDAAYPELNLDSYLNDFGRQVFAKQRQACVVDGLLRAPLLHIRDVTTSNPLDSPAWQARLAEQKLGAAPPTVPILLYHAWPVDELVDRAQAKTLRRTYCAAKDSIEGAGRRPSQLTGCRSATRHTVHRQSQCGSTRRSHSQSINDPQCHLT